MTEKISQKIFDYFIINHRYFAIQKGGLYFAKNQYINQKTIEKILNNKESFLAYQEDYNYLKWICFDFDINKEFIDNGEFDKNKEKFYNDLIDNIQTLTIFLDVKQIDYLLEFSGNRGLHIWIIFDEKVTRQDAFVIFQAILKQSNINLNTQYFSLDKYPKSMYSSKGTDKGTGVKIPFSFHQKSKKYSLLFKKLEDFDIAGFDISEMDKKIIKDNYSILDEYILQNRDELFDKLSITQEVIKEEQEKHNFLNSISISFKDEELSSIIHSLNNCQHLQTIFSKDIPSDKERRIVVGMLGQLKNENGKVGKSLLKSYFMSRTGANETIIDQRLAHSDKFCPPTCDYLRNEYGVNCNCESINQTPLEFLEGFDYVSKEIFDFTFDIFNDIKKSQIRYTKQNDEIALFHVLNNLNRYDYSLIKNDISLFLNSLLAFENTYSFLREEKNKNRSLYSISARDKIITTFGMKILDSLFYKKFSSRSFGYKFNPSFRHNDIFEGWLKQWNMYKKELETLIYSEDFKYYYILKLDIKSYYDTINLQKLQIELNYEIEQSFNSESIDENEKKVFLNIINNLLNFSRKITNDQEKGLPQGPAFARYLAEIYLTSLDKVIEREIEAKHGYYYRYVDDMFIILPRKENIDLMERKIIEHLDTKYISINPNKTYKGMINNFYQYFDEYIDNTKYFIDNVDKHQHLRTKTMIHRASSQLLALVEKKNDEINDKNLTFFFTHFNDSKMVEEKREELENYVIYEAKGRGSFFNIFWRYYFDKYDLEEIDFLSFNHLRGLKRETFFNSLIIISKNNFIENSSLKQLLDAFLETDLTENEQLFLLELYMLNSNLYNSDLLNIIGDNMEIYNDLMLSEFSKELPEEMIASIATKLVGIDNKSRQFEYLYNMMLFSQSNNTELFKKLSRIFIDIVTTLIDRVEVEIEYLSDKSNFLKYIQLLYISTLFYGMSKTSEETISRIWQNLLFNINQKKIYIEKHSIWIDKLKNTLLINSNINFILPLVKNNRNILSKNQKDESSIIVNYFDALIELIYLSHKDDKTLENLDEIKQFLIDEKNMKYLDWIDGEGSYYPTKEICIRNAIYNDITILQRENQLLVRLLNKDEHNIDFEYLNIIESSEENIFNHKYKTIIYEYNSNEYKQVIDNSCTNLFQVIVKVINTHNELDTFSNKYFPETKYINHFYNQFRIHIDTKMPLIPYDCFNPYFVKDEDKYDYRNESSYLFNIIEQIHNSKKKFFPNDHSGIFDDFKENFFPTKIMAYSQKIKYLKSFAEKVQRKIPQDIFEMEDYLIETILSSKEDMKLFEFFDIYLSSNRGKENKKYLLFNYVGELKDKTLEEFFITVEHSLNNSSMIKDLFSEGKDKVFDKIGNFADYEVCELKYEEDDDGEIEITINNHSYTLDNLEYIELDFDIDELHFFDIAEKRLQFLEKNETLLYIYKEDDTAKLILIPDILTTIFTIIKHRKKAFEKVETSYLIKPFKTIEELKDGYDDNFNKAVNVLMAHRKYSPLQANMEHHLYQWLNCFRDDRQIDAMLYVIANHQVLSDTDVSQFINNIEKYRNQNEYLITTLKTAEDNNGTHRLITLQTDNQDLWRKLDLKDFPTKLLQTTKEKIVFLSDVMISGTQTKRAFEEYYLLENWQEIKDKRPKLFEKWNDIKTNREYLIMIKSKMDFFRIDDKFEKFKTQLLSLKEIVFISTIYTSEAKKNIQKYFDGINFQGRINFIGEEKEFDNCIFNGLIEQNNKDEFISIVQNVNFVKNNFSFPERMNNQSYKRHVDNRNYPYKNIIARFNSMPKSRFLIFTLQPKYHDKPLFQYRKD